MYRKVSLISVLLLSGFVLWGQKKAEIILSIGDKKFTKEEFIRIYQKNNMNLQSDSDRKSPAEYMELFINFQLKVMEAESLKMDTGRAFIDELAGYRKELAAPYLTDISFTEKMVEDTYQRMKSEVSARHILVNLKSGAGPADTLAAYEKAMKIREEILHGLNFDEAAVKYSDDPSAKQNTGKLGYFTAFQMVYPFELAAFTTPVGQVSLPFRTNFGYHLVKVEDLRLNRGEIRVAHIMKSFPPGSVDSVRFKARNEAEKIHRQLLEGADFAELAGKYSDDKRTSVSGGELPWFSSGRMIPEFSEPAFSIEENGAFTKPVESPFGYHIIKRLEYKPIDSFEKLKKDIENKLKMDPERSLSNKQAFIRKMESEYHYELYSENLKQFIAASHGLFEKGKWNSMGTGSFPMALFRLDGKDYSGDQFAAYLSKQVFAEQMESPEQEIGNHFIAWKELKINELEESRLDKKYPEFHDIMREYHDGILLFNISDEKIWSFAGKDSVGLTRFYEQNKGKYLWGERFKGMIINCPDQETRYEVDKYFAADMTRDEIIDLIRKKGKKVDITEGLWAKNENPVVDFYVWLGSRFDGFNELLTFIRGDKIGPQPKSLEEAKGPHIADYQKYLEDKWISDLKKKFRVRINKKLLNSVNDSRN